ncbi:MAG: septal ring lytic transglycosylase RlpA family protein [Coriobacteriia bacterium]
MTRGAWLAASARIAGVLVAVLTLGVPVRSLSLPLKATFVTSSTVSPTTASDPETMRAVDLQHEIEDLEGESVAIDERVAVTSLRIYEQQVLVDAARSALDAARAEYDSRLVQIYKTGAADPLLVLLGASSIADLVSRASVFTRLADVYREAFGRARLAAAEADFEARILDDLRAQDVALRDIKDRRLARSRELLEEQSRILARLDAASQAVVQRVRETGARTRREWRAGSVPLSAEIPMVAATVRPYLDRTYTVPSHRPRVYSSTGMRFTAVCSWYGNEFNGRPTASGQIFNQNDLTCASRTLPFGTLLALSRAGHRIVVVVNDRGPFISGRDLDLSRGAARALGFSGVEAVEAEFVEVVQEQ